MRRFALLVVVFLGACGGGGADDDGDAGQPDAATPVVQQDYGGDYTVDGTWDLSSPFGGDGVGGAVADIMIDQVVDLAGVPDAVHEQARDLVAGQVRQPIMDYVNGVLPPSLETTGSTMTALTTICSAIHASGTMTLTPDADPDDFAGSEAVTAISASYQGTTYQVSMPELLQGAVSVGADFTGTATGPAAVAIGSHELALRFGALVAILARDALGVDVYALAEQAMAAIDCNDLVAAITGGGASYSVSVAGQSYSVSTTTLVDACDSKKLDLRADALGFLDVEAGIRLAGPASLADPNADHTTDTVASAPGYGGGITALPIPYEPQVTATFVATRAVSP